ncbi:hypothetical protein LTR85_009648 [Meristemomyces frigidus]|nr:hypothetical protein LTR85_009648 [Meristemomyces frigidus]
MQSTTRMDVLSNMLSGESTAGKMPSVKNQSPRDSLSPLDHSFKHDDINGKSEHASRDATPAGSKWSPPLVASPTKIQHRDGKQQLTSTADAGTRDAQQRQQEAHITFLEHGQTHEAATLGTSTSSQQACSPRSSPLITRPHRPTTLRLTQSNGLTSTSTRELKQRIGDGHTGTDSRATRTQVPRTRPPKRLPKTPLPAPFAMGNAHSSDHHHTEREGPAEDNASLSSVVRKPMRVLRKSSGNMFKRIDSKSPLPPPLTATSILVTQNKHGSLDEDDSPIDPFMDPAHKAREPIILHSGSTMTVTEENAGQPLSASTTLKEARRDSTSPYQATVDDGDSDFDDAPPVPAHRSSALSPTIPAPSPLPEDSPHKYGLKDRMDTPELVKEEPPPDINVMKARRRSSGLEIFNEAKSLQSAQSFLNGLSTSRRRAESTNRSTNDTWASTETSRPVSRPGSRAPSTRPPSAMHLHSTTSNTNVHASAYTSNPNLNSNTDISNDGRHRGHNFKSNGFAYSRALNLTQLKCYRNHSRLLRSKNKQAPVECAVCHMDDDQEHWTCSWCAMRMCRYCRKGFAEGGVTALRARIKEAETGSSPSSSMESLGGGRGRSRLAFV